MIKIPFGNIIRRVKGKWIKNNKKAIYSYDDLGTQYIFIPRKIKKGQKFGFDVERINQPFDDILLEYWGIPAKIEFYSAWTVAEVLCKIHNIPILVWLRNKGLYFYPIEEFINISFNGKKTTLFTTFIPKFNSIITVGNCLIS